MFVDFGARLNDLACIRDERACEVYDQKQREIQSLSDKIFSKLSDDDFNDISEKIRISLGLNDIDPDGLTVALKGLCYDDAECRINKLKNAN